MPVQDFDRVHAGDVLAQIVDDDYRAVVEPITAAIAAAAAQVRAVVGAPPTATIGGTGSVYSVLEAQY